jgi:hypothetical protein
MPVRQKRQGRLAAAMLLNQKFSSNTYKDEAIPETDTRLRTIPNHPVSFRLRVSII